MSPYMINTSIPQLNYYSKYLLKYKNWLNAIESKVRKGNYKKINVICMREKDNGEKWVLTGKLMPHYPKWSFSTSPEKLF